MLDYLALLPAFLLYFGVGAALLAAFGAIYGLVTPHEEVALVRSGNLSATIAFLGALLGFTLVMASAATNSVSIVDLALWSAVGLIVQVAAFFAASALKGDVSRRISDGEVSAGTWVAGVAVIVGILNAACMTY